MRRFSLVIAIAACLLPPATAHADTYNVTACADAPAVQNNSWVLNNNAASPGQLETGSQCGGDSPYAGLYARDALTCVDSCPFPASGASASWSFSAPTGTSVTRIAYSRWFFKRDDDDWELGLTVDGQHRIDDCRIEYPASTCVVGAEYGVRTTVDLGGSQTLTVGVRCRANPSGNCTTGGTLHELAAVIYGATVTLSDPSAPALSEPTGSLFDPGYRTGQHEVAFSASDNSGVKSARLYVDGQAQPAIAYACDFTYTVPCSDRPDGGLSLDTRDLGDGTHQVQVAVTDAASNETRSAVRTIIVDNNAPAAPVNVAVEGQEGVNDFTVRWDNPAGQTAPIAAAHWRLCDSGGTRCTSGELRGPDPRAIRGIVVPDQGEWRLSVFLEDDAGHRAEANSASTWLRYYRPLAPTTPIDPAPAFAADESVAEAPAAPLSTPATTPALAVARATPRLRITTLRFANRRLLVRGHTATTAAGKLTIRYRSGRRTLTIRRTVRGGAFALRLPASRRPRTILLRYPGTARFLPQSLRVRPAA